ncbi:MAG: helix-turn-helix domain-containing protein, partial [Bradymonadaceae bacterium]
RKPKATRQDVVEALRRAGDDHAEAARHLEVSERTLYRYLNRYDL